MRIGYLECFSGISGDMFLGALVDAGVPLDTLRNTAAALNIGARLEARKVTRGGIAGTRVDVISPESGDARVLSGDHDHGHAHAHDREHDHDHVHAHDHPHAHEDEGSHAHTHHRPLSVILDIIRSATLDAGVKERAARAFQLLGEAEAAIHSIPVEQVHFHEVGAVDTIVDIVCAAAGAMALGVDRWLATPLNVGSGTVRCAHGTLPVPAPATLALLGSAPIYSAGPPMERVTPTGAVILRMLGVEYTSLPAMRIEASGYGAGSRETPGEPNLLRLLAGEADAAIESSEPLAVLEAVIDDSTPQVLAYASELLLAAGAWDVYRIPVQMKKGRAGVQVTVLCAPERLATLREILFRETTTIGAHWRIESKIALEREFAQVQTAWGPVSIKVARSASGEVLNAAPEYEDCRRIAAASRIPLKQVMREAARLYAEANPIQGKDADGPLKDRGAAE